MHWTGDFGHMLRFIDLEQEEKKLLLDDLFIAVHENAGKKSAGMLVAEVFSYWGVMCIHPQECRAYEGKNKYSSPSFTHRWYTCESCGCSSVNEHYISTKALSL